MMANANEDKRFLRREHVHRRQSDILDTSILGIAQTGFHFLIKIKLPLLQAIHCHAG